MKTITTTPWIQTQFGTEIKNRKGIRNRKKIHVFVVKTALKFGTFFSTKTRLFLHMYSLPFD